MVIVVTTSRQDRMQAGCGINPDLDDVDQFIDLNICQRQSIAQVFM